MAIRLDSLHRSLAAVGALVFTSLLITASATNLPFA